MSLRADHKALVFLGAVAVLGAGVRVSRAASRSVANPTAQAALDRQMASADSAAAAGRSATASRRSGVRGGKRSSRYTQMQPPDSTSAADSQQARPSRKHAAGPKEGSGYLNGRLDLDVATAAQIDSLPGVPPTIAKRIAADRMKRGPFLSLDGLRRVSGVGPALAKHLDSLVTFSGAFSQGNPQDSTIRGRGRKSKRGGAMRPVALRTGAPPPMRSRL